MIVPFVQFKPMKCREPWSLPRKYFRNLRRVLGPLQETDGDAHVMLGVDRDAESEIDAVFGLAPDLLQGLRGAVAAVLHVLELQGTLGGEAKALEGVLRARDLAGPVEQIPEDFLARRVPLQPAIHEGSFQLPPASARRCRVARRGGGGRQLIQMMLKLCLLAQRKQGDVHTLEMDGDRVDLVVQQHVFEIRHAPNDLIEVHGGEEPVLRQRDDAFLRGFNFDSFTNVAHICGLVRRLGVHLQPLVKIVDGQTVDEERQEHDAGDVEGQHLLHLGVDVRVLQDDEAHDQGDGPAQAAVDQEDELLQINAIAEALQDGREDRDHQRAAHMHRDVQTCKFTPSAPVLVVVTATCVAPHEADGDDTSDKEDDLIADVAYLLQNRVQGMPALVAHLWPHHEGHHDAQAHRGEHTGEVEGLGQEEGAIDHAQNGGRLEH
mmetsp:Transcript_104834/g.338050  ORF Transcript_104834/g.338050 Transcript_104834/m.338050 type:complete len:434 (-) Transcript_104834:1120-2421(-)